MPSKVTAIYGKITTVIDSVQRRLEAALSRLAVQEERSEALLNDVRQMKDGFVQYAKEVNASLYNLKKSIRLDQLSVVESDPVERLLNERISRLESVNKSLGVVVNNLTDRVSALENVIRSVKTLVGFVSKV